MVGRRRYLKQINSRQAARLYGRRHEAVIGHISYIISPMRRARRLLFSSVILPSFDGVAFRSI